MNNYYYEEHNVVQHGFMNKVYGWMAAGLSVTAAIAYYLSPAVNPQLFVALQNYLLIFMVMQLGVVFYCSMAFKSLSYSSLAVLFTIYSGLMGITLSPIAYIYTGESIFQIFLIAAGMFLIMAVYGTVTKTDLSSMGNILFMGLVGLMIAQCINLFWRNAQLDMMTAAIGVVVFVGLVAYDVQKLRNFGSQAIASSEDIDKVALMGALTLYLDVVNLFLHLLRLFGKKRD